MLRVIPCHRGFKLILTELCSENIVVKISCGRILKRKDLIRAPIGDLVTMSKK